MKKMTNSSNVHVDHSTITGTHVTIAGRDIIQSKAESNVSLQDFLNLITEIQATLKRIDLDPEEKQGVETNLALAKKQAAKEKPDGETIVSSLTTALNVVKLAGGAAKAIGIILPMIQQAITFAHSLF